jgi:hypothetical protein
MSAAAITGELVDPLTDDEFADRERLETIITRGFGSFVEVGSALIEVRDRLLYRDRHSTFVAYLEKQWQVSESRAYQLMTAAVVTLEISTVVEDAPDDSPLRGTPLPQNEAQARELARFVGQPVLAAEVLREAEKSGAPTAQKIKAAANTIAPPPKKKKTKTTTVTETKVETAAAPPAEPAKAKPPAKRAPGPEQRTADGAHKNAESLFALRPHQIDERTIRLLEAVCRRWREQS